MPSDFRLPEDGEFPDLPVDLFGGTAGPVDAEPEGLPCPAPVQDEPLAHLIHRLIVRTRYNSYWRWRLRQQEPGRGEG